MEVFFLIMARPKSSDVDAKKRLSEAFWDLLSRQPYNQITVKSLCSTAKVNHNTIYYYFSSWEDMVVSFFLDNLDEEIPQTIFDAVVTGNGTLTLKSGAMGDDGIWIAKSFILDSPKVTLNLNTDITTT